MEPSSAPWRVLESPDQEPPAPTPPGPTRDLPWLAIIALLGVLAVAVLAFLLASRSEPVIEVDGAGGAAAGAVVDGRTIPGATSPEAGLPIVVEVGGAVVRPGVYRLAAGSRVGDAIAAAGGFGARVDAALADRKLNLAALVKDGDEVHVPLRGEATAGEAVPGPAGATDGERIDLNRATAEQLDTLPGIGPATAAKIIAAREEQPFGSVDDLGTRKVVGAATLEKIRMLVTAGR